MDTRRNLFEFMKTSKGDVSSKIEHVQNDFVSFFEKYNVYKNQIQKYFLQSNFYKRQTCYSKKYHYKTLNRILNIKNRFVYSINIKN